MKARHILAAAALTALALPAAGQTLKPGLWEVTNKMQTSSGEMEKSMAQMQQQMASMPPEQRRMMEEMMAKQGMKMGGGMNVRTCMTKEMVERNEMPSQHGDCKTTSQARTGNTMKFAFSCTNPPSTGEGQVTFVSSEAYTTRVVVNTSVGGKPEKMNMQGSGKWLGADCGAIKPPGQALKK